MLRLHLYCFRQHRLESNWIVPAPWLPPCIPAPLRTPPAEPQACPRLYCIQQGQQQQHLICHCWLWQRPLGFAAAMAACRGELKISVDVACLTSLPSTKEENSPELQPTTMQTARWHSVKHVGQCENTAVTQRVLHSATAQGCPQLLESFSKNWGTDEEKFNHLWILQVHWGGEKLYASALFYFLWHVHHVTSVCVKMYYVTWWHRKGVSGGRSSLLKT